MKDKKKLIVIAGIIGLLISIIGITYAYFSVSISGNENASSILVQTARLGLTYNSGDTITGNKILPGWNDSKTFSVTNTSTVKMYYSINWSEVTNTFINKSDLVYELSGARTKDETTVPSSEAIILEGIEIEVGATHNYTIIITYKETGSDQSIDMGKSFIGKIIINESEKSGEPNYLNEKIIADVTDKNQLKGDAPNSLFQNISTNADTGLWTYPDGAGSSYFFRGTRELLDNNIIFAGYQWKIVRIDSNGNIKLIYNGECTNNSCIGNINTTGTSTQVKTTAFNPNSNDPKYIGYTYDTNVDSAIKIENEAWYKTNIREKGYDSYIADVTYCNDRSGARTVSTVTYYAPYDRIFPAGSYSSVTPSLSCTNETDRYTNTSGKLSEKVGLITADEVALAGGKFNAGSSSYFLYTNQYYWTLSPSAWYSSGASVWYVSSTGSLDANYVVGAGGLRPYITLNSNIEISSGNGSVGNPYIVKAI